MQTITHTNAILDVSNVYMICCIQLLSEQRLFRCDYCEHQQSVHNLKSSTFGYQWAALSHPSKVNVLVGVLAKKANDPLIATS
jgi:hypothetical protein